MRRARFLTLALAAISALTPGLAGAAAIEISGRVQAEDGSALAGAAVELRPVEAAYRQARGLWTGERAPLLARALSDAAGFYALRAPGPGFYELLVAADGRAPVWIPALPLVEPVVLPPATPHTGAEVIVRVVDGDGRAIAGALLAPIETTVDLDRPTWKPASPTLATGRDGRATLRLPREADRVRAWTVTAAGFVGRRAEIAGAATVALSPVAPALEVRVRERDGRPVAGAFVVGADDISLALTGDDGRARLAPPDKTAEIRTADGRVWKGRLASGAGGAPAVVTLAPAPPLAGAVVDAASRAPLAGAVVASTSDLGHWAVSDARGSYSLSSEGEGRLGLMAWASGHFRGAGGAPAWSARAPTLALSPGARVTGWVVDPGRLPIAGAALEVRPREEMDFRRGWQGVLSPAVSGRDGAFSILAPVQASASLAVAAASFSPRRVPLPGMPPGRRRPPLTIVLDAGRAVIGRVVDPAGAPVPGAEVRWVPDVAASGRRSDLLVAAAGRADQLSQSAQATTGADGAFRLQHLAPGRAGLVARRRGFAPAVIPGLETATRQTTDLGPIALQPGAALEGRVADGRHRPVAGAQVSLLVVFRTAQVKNSVQLDPVVTGPEGSFRFADLQEGAMVDLQVSREGYETRFLTKVAVPAAHPLEVVLDRAARIAGRVVDETGSPVAGARVTAEPEDGSLPFYRRFERDRPTAEDGSFAIERAPSGHVRLEASAQGFEPAQRTGLEVPAGGALEGVEVTLQHGAAVVGTVVAADGRPAAGASVEAGGTGAMTDGDGAYRIEGVARGHQRISASHPDLGTGAVDVEVGPGETRADLRLASGATLEGRVADRAGAPVPEALVTLDGRLGFPRTTESDAQGGYRFEQVTAGSYRLYARLDERRSPGPSRAVDVGAEPLAGLDLTLDRGGALSGRIVGARPADLAGLMVEARGPEGRGGTGEVAADASYRIEGLAAGDWRVTAVAGATGRSGQGRVTLADGADAELDITLGGGLSLQGEVTKNGRPVDGARVDLAEAPGSSPVPSRAGDLTDYLGRFRLEGLDRGQATLWVHVPFSSLSEQRSVDLEDDQTVAIDFQVGGVAGSVVDGATGRPLEAATVTIRSTAAGSPAQQDRTSDAQGHFGFDDLAAGAYALTVQKTGYATQSATVDVSPQGTATLAVPLVPGAEAPRSDRP